MSHLLRNNKIQVFRVGLSLMLFVMIMSLASCRKPEKVAAVNEAQKTFASPEEAGSALLRGCKVGRSGFINCDLRP